MIQIDVRDINELCSAAALVEKLTETGMEYGQAYKKVGETEPGGTIVIVTGNDVTDCKDTYQYGEDGWLHTTQEITDYT